MEIRVAQTAGYCFGVRRAMDLAKQTAEHTSGPIYTLGPLIHNEQAVAQLARRGIQVAEDLSRLKKGTVIIRTHGLPPEQLAQVKGQGLHVVDATCPFVGRAQKRAAELAAAGYQVVIVGNPNHPEVEGVSGATGYRALVVSSPDEVRRHRLSKKVGVVAQTTQILSVFQECVAAVLEQALEVVVHQTICSATRERQDEAQEMAREFPLMLVVGGRNSANTNKLAEICSREGARAFLVEGAAELNPVWFDGVEKVGITAGASTPDWVIEDVIRRIREILPDARVNVCDQRPAGAQTASGTAEE